MAERPSTVRACLLLLLGLARALHARQEAPPRPDLDIPESWIEPTEPVKIAGPIHYVGTKGLAAYLITTPKGHLLLDGGLPQSAKDIEASIRKLGFKPEDIRFLLITHAHIDHAGTTAYFKKLSNAEVVVMDREFELLASGGKTDFRYGDVPAFSFPAVTADRQIKDGETVSFGNVKMTARLGAGHTKGATTWTTKVEDGGKPYDVVFPCCMSVNPGYRLVVDPSYPGIADDYTRTAAMLESLKPDIWLPAHTEAIELEAKRASAAKEGVQAWVDPEGYASWVAKQKATFEQALAKEKLLGNPESAPEGLAGTSWKLVRFQGGDEKILTPDDPSKYTLEFLADGKLAARIDCNRGAGTWTSEGPNQLELGPLGLTRMACPPSPVSDRILKDWSYVRSYVLKDNRLFVSLMADGGIYEFELLGRQASATTGAAPPLEGTYWKLIRLGDVSVAAPSSKREPHLTLDAQARRVTGSGGCNRVTGSYEVNGDRLSFSRVAITKMACVDGMENETDFLKALELAKTWRIDGDSLELFGAEGKSLARFEAGSAPS